MAITTIADIVRQHAGERPAVSVRRDLRRRRERRAAAVPDERWGEAVKAVVVMKPDCNVSPEELVEFARTELAGFKVPKSADLADVLPRNPSGKLLKREIRAPYWEGRERQIN